MTDTIKLIADTIHAINETATSICDNRAVIATPVALAGAKVANVGGMTHEIITNLIIAARQELLSSEGNIIPGPAGKLKKLGVVLHTVKASSPDMPGNALVYIQTKQGIIVVQQAAGASTIRNMLNWGQPTPVIEKEVEKVVEKIVEVEVVREVPAEIPKGFRDRLKLLFG